MEKILKQYIGENLEIAAMSELNSIVIALRGETAAMHLQNISRITIRIGWETRWHSDSR